MELRHLRYFVAVAEELNFRRAAARLFIEQPPLSRQIQDLEREVGVLLLRRVGRRVELTEAGAAFLREARTTLLQAERAIESARRADRGEVGRLTIGFSVYAFQGVLPCILRAYRRAYSEVEVSLAEMCTPTQLKALESGEIDVAFPHASPALPWLETRLLTREPLILALPDGHPLAERDPVPLAALADEPFVLFPAHQHVQIHAEILAMCQHAGFTPRIVEEATPPPVAVGLVEAGIGVSLFARSLGNVPRPGVVFRDLDVTTPCLNLYVAWHRDRVSRTACGFLDLVRKTL